MLNTRNYTLHNAMWDMQQVEDDTVGGESYVWEKFQLLCIPVEEFCDSNTALFYLF